MLQYLKHTRSKITGALWLTMAVFFLFFCSTPVKKYIRMQLYKHAPALETTQGERLSTHDIKDCLVAERQGQAKILISSFSQVPDAPQDFTVFFVPALLLFSLLIFVNKEAFSFVPERQRPPFLATGPRYLLLRHLQV